MSNARRFSLFLATALAVAAAAAPGAQAAWSAASWTLPSTTSQLTSSSCVGTTFCVLVGYQPSSSPRALTYKYNGSDYTSTAPSSTTSELYGVHCQSTTFCMAVGTDYATATPAPHASKFNGTSWSAVTTVTPTGNTFSELRGVSCPTATHCWAAGRFQTATKDTPLIETYNNTSFSQVAVTPPAGTTASELNEISCSAVNACTAVGWYDSASPRTPLVFRYNGTSWTTQAAALPAGTTYAELNGVSCPTATSCDAVGFYLDGSSVQHSLAQTWNGTSWANRSVADPSGGQEAVLSGVSCTSATFCEAVGSYTNSTNLNIEKLAATFNGSAWSLQTDGRPTGVSDAQLAGISCTSTTFCRAAGVSIYDGSTGVTGPRPAIDAGP
jgi:hypothetical protein